MLDWKGNKDIDSYVVRIGSERSLSATSTEQVKATGTRVTLSDLASTTPGTDRYYRVEAVRDGKVRSSRTARFTLKPGEIGKVALRRTTADGVKVTWRDVANARQFDVAVARDKAFSKAASTVRTVSGDHSFVTRGLRPDTTYWVKVRPVNRDQTGAFSKPLKVTTDVRETTFRVGTWNVCSEKCAAYGKRAPIASALLQANKIDIFGLQESGGVRVGATTNAVFSGGAQGFVRADGGAEARYIFYRPAIFTQLSGSYFPVGDGRHATWAKFKVNDTGRIFYYVDVHLEDGKSKAKNAQRTRETNVMLGKMSAINDTGKPMIWAGDFNTGTHRPQDTPGTIMRGAGYLDTFELAKEPINGQYNSAHGRGDAVPTSGARIDHIYVTKEFAVLGWNQLVRLTNGRQSLPFVSDHNALSADVALDAVARSIGTATPVTPLPAADTSLP